MTDTIFALSSGAPPAAISIIRVSGPAAVDALCRLAGKMPAPRQAALRTLRDEAGDRLDHALVLWFPAPASVTGEDVAELHCHGGRAVVAAIEATLAGLPGLRRAEPGEFTRRAFVNGRIDLTEAEGLADLLAAETQAQRRSALAMSGGVLSRQVEDWRERLLTVSAQVEAVLDFDDEGDVALGNIAAIDSSLRGLVEDMATWLARPHAETLREGVRVVLAGPPNAGKSTLFNALVGSDAAITDPRAGTTRDVLVQSVAWQGVPFTLVDTAGLNDDAVDAVEIIGIARARAVVTEADIVLWLGSGDQPPGAWSIEAQIDRHDAPRKEAPRHRVSALTGDGLPGLIADLVASACALLPKPNEAALATRQRRHLAAAASAMTEAQSVSDPLLVAEHLRVARSALDALVGRTTTDDMLDTLFGRFCIGK